MNWLLSDSRLLFGVCFIVMLVCLEILYLAISSRIDAVEKRIKKIEHETPLVPERIFVNFDGARGICPGCSITVTDKVDIDECKWCHQRLRWPVKKEDIKNDFGYKFIIKKDNEENKA